MTKTQTLAPIVGTSDGTFLFTGLPAANYLLAIKGPLNLQKVLSIPALAGDVTDAAVTLAAGDANGDNSIDSSDFGILIGAFNTDGSVPGSGYDPTADFNYDGLIDSSDFGLLISNFNTQGDP